MNNQNYMATIEFAKSPEDVFNRIKDVSKWWSKDFEGCNTRIQFGIEKEQNTLPVWLYICLCFNQTDFGSCRYQVALPSVW